MQGLKRAVSGLIGLLLLFVGTCAFGVLAAPPASAAANCDISKFTSTGGTIDTTGYLACQFPSVDPSSVAPGGTVKVCAGGFAPDSVVTISLDGTGLTTAPVDGSGSICTTVVLPAGESAGSHNVNVSGKDANGDPLTVVLAVTVTRTNDTLPVTGGDVARYLGLAVGLIALGSAAVYGARRYRTGIDSAV
jgi:hypothetical protein